MGPFGVPILVDLINLVERQDLVLGLVLLAAGLVFLTLGCRIVTPLVAISFAAIGLLVGLHLPAPLATQWICGVVGGLGLAVASTFAVKIAVAVLGGCWAGYIGMVMVHQFGTTDTTALIVGGVLMLGAFSLAFVMYHHMIAFATSIEGALLFTGGLIVFFSHNAGAWTHLRRMLAENLLFGPFLIMAGTVTGFYLQLTDVRKKQSGASG